MTRKTHARAQFPTTHWSLIGRAAESHATEQRIALNQLLEQYWPALRTFLVVHRGTSEHDADDLVQAFIHDRILEKDLLSRATQSRGRFRSLLATSLSNFAVSQHERRMAKKREPDRAAALPEHPLTPAESRSSGHDAFDIAWARQTLTETLRRMHRECLATSRPDIWDVFLGRLCRPLDGTHSEPVSLADIARRHQLRSAAQASNLLITATRRFRRVLRGVIGEYAVTDEELEAEIGDLVDVLRDVVITLDLSEQECLELHMLSALEHSQSDWTAGDLSDILAHLLASPLQQELKEFDAGAMCDLTDRNRFQSIRETLTSPDVTRELLLLLKRFAKDQGGRADSIPREVSAVLYLSAIAAALVAEQEPISELDSTLLRERLQWVTTEQWVDPDLRLLCARALDRTR